MTGTQPDTPKRARIKGAYEFLEAKGLPYYKTDLFEHFQVSRATGYRILADESTRTRHSKPVMSENGIRKRKRFEDEEKIQGERSSRIDMTEEDNIEPDVSTQTVRDRARIRDLYDQLAAGISSEASRRLESSTYALSKRSRPEDWRDVIFLDQWHFSYAAGRRDQTARESHIQLPTDSQERVPEEMGERQLDFWTAIGHDLKSPLVWYGTLSDTNSTTTHIVDERDVFEPYIKKWIEEGYSFALDELDNGSGHEIEEGSPIQIWKERYGLERFVNCPSTRGPSPVDKCWVVANEYLRGFSDWDMKTLKHLIQGGWNELSKETINKWVETMPQRLQHIIDKEGKITRY